MKISKTQRGVAPRSRPLVEDFETRILYSADTPGGMMAATLHDPTQEVVQQVAARAPQALDASELVFIDSRVANAAQIEADIAAQAAAGRPIEAIVLDANQDGITQISNLLSSRNDVSAVHIISHGSEASVQLGSTRLDNDELLMRAGDIAAWGSHLRAAADLLIYGCDVGVGSDGQALVNGLAQLTGADVAASTDLTGAKALGGDWTLEAQTGAIQVASAIDAAGQAQWQGVLAADTAPTIGTPGSGKVTSNMGSTDRGLASALQSDGKVLVAGVSNSQFVLARYNADGSLDTSFGTNGWTSTTIGANSQAAAVAVQSDGKIVVGGSANGDFAVVRYNADGSLDTGFGTSGKTTVDFAGSTDGIYGLALQSDGKIVATGQACTAGGVAQFGTVRLTTSGALDTSFNTTGKVQTALGSSQDTAYGVVIQSDGKIVVAGSSSQSGLYNVAVVRYTSAGALDTSFNSTGKVLTNLVGPSYGSSAYSVALQSDGKIVVGGSVGTAAGSSLAVWRYTTAGALDTTFNGTGQATISSASYNTAYSVAVQSDGKIVAAGSTGTVSVTDFIAARLNTNGSADTSFGSSGTVATDFGANEVARGVLVQSDGSIVAAGYTSSNSYDFAVARYTAAGALDTGWGVVGGLGNSIYYTENASPVVLNSAVIFSDAELNSAGNYSAHR